MHMSTQVEILHKYIKLNYTNKEVFAQDILGMTRQNLNKITKEAKENNNGEFKFSFLALLKEKGIDIFQDGNKKEPPDGEIKRLSMLVEHLNAKIIDKEDIIATQKVTISELTKRADALTAIFTSALHKSTTMDNFFELIKFNYFGSKEEVAVQSS